MPRSHFGSSLLNLSWLETLELQPLSNLGRCRDCALARRHVSVGQRKRRSDVLREACASLLDHPEIETAIRVGDVYALMVEHEYGARNHQAALELIEQMEARNIIVAPYLDADMVNTIYSSLGRSRAAQHGGGGGGGGGGGEGMWNGSDDGVGEEIEESLDESLEAEEQWTGK